MKIKDLIELLEEENPKAKGVQTRKRHIPRADHEWHEVVRKAEGERHADQKNHGRAVHGEALVEDIRRQEVVIRKSQLNAHEPCEEAGDDEEKQSRPDIHEAEFFVVYREDQLLHDASQRSRLLPYPHGFRHAVVLVDDDFLRHGAVGYLRVWR